MVMHLPCALAAVSEAVQAILGSEFGRQPLIIPNGIDCHRFTPGPRSRLQPTTTMACVPNGQVLDCCVAMPKPCSLAQVLACLLVA
jgi:hypothetical protein